MIEFYVSGGVLRTEPPLCDVPKDYLIEHQDELARAKWEFLIANPDCTNGGGRSTCVYCQLYVCCDCPLGPGRWVCSSSEIYKTWEENPCPETAQAVLDVIKEAQEN